jgi:glycyl-tRNA synthetase beta chain
MAEFFVELQSEEIPAGMQARAEQDLARSLGKALADAGLGGGVPRTTSGPRRLSISFPEVAARQPDQREERRGPRVGAPDQAIQGFLKATGLAGLGDAEQREVGGAPYWFAVIERPGRPAPVVLAELLARAVKDFAWPKSMRWGDLDQTWVRPLRAIVATFDGRALAGGVPLGEGRSIAFGDQTVGHRFLAPATIQVTGHDGYVAALEAAYVIADRARRVEMIGEGAARLAGEAGLSLAPDPALIEEVAGLVEWPVPLIGAIDPPFMDLPPEVLVTSMRAHQRYLALRDAAGRLAPRFIVVANMVNADGGRQVVAGNERVLRARLSDARFFFDQDRKLGLDAFASRLDQRVYHAKLGTVAERVRRLERLAAELAPQVGARPDHARRAALLAKADLATGMVGEFPELQGVMGGHYARHQGEHADVADAIERHYAPLGPKDQVPTRPVAIAVALADKLDALAAFFAIGERPTGSGDPFALRRAALGVLRILLENRLSLALTPALVLAQAGLDLRAPPAFDAGAIVGFMRERLEVHLRGEGQRHDVVRAALGQASGDDFLAARGRVEALAAFVGSTEGGDLLAGFRRAANILRIEERETPVLPDIASDLLVLPAEVALAEAQALIDAAVRGHVGHDDPAAALAALAGLRQPIDRFFDEVTVNAEEAAIRRNRLALLARVRATFATIADFQAIEG